MEDIANLSAEQQSTLEQYTAITNQQLEEAIPILRRSEWNLQIAISRFFDGEPAAIPDIDPAPPQDSRRVDNLMDTFPTSYHHRGAPRLQPAPRIVPKPNSHQTFNLFFPFNIILAPFSLVTFIFSRIFRTISPFIPFLPAILNNVQTQQPRKALTTKETASNFIRQFEKEFGTHQLPFLGKGYAHSLDEAKKDLKFLLVVLISSEHDDTKSYVTETLASQEVISFISDKANNILLWGGNVRDNEAYQVSTAFRVTKFPYAALIAHTPNSASRSSSSGMSIITTMVGPMPPSEFVAKMRLAIQSHNPELSRLRSERAEREVTRNIRAEQDSAYERSLATDRERARKKKEEAEKAKKQQEDAAKAEKEAQELADRHDNWKMWRAAQVQPEPEVSDKNATRVSLRLPNGERIVRRFDGNAPIEELYAVVECWDILKDQTFSKDAGKPKGYTPRYNFQLVSPMPRAVYSAQSSDTIGKSVGRNANLIVEALTEEEDD